MKLNRFALNDRKLMFVKSTLSHTHTGFFANLTILFPLDNRFNHYLWSLFPCNKVYIVKEFYILSSHSFP